MDQITVGAIARSKRPGVRLRVVARGGEIRVAAHTAVGVVTATAPFLAMHEALLSVLSTLRALAPMRVRALPTLADLDLGPEGERLVPILLSTIGRLSRRGVAS